MVTHVVEAAGEHHLGERFPGRKWRAIDIDVRRYVVRARLVGRDYFMTNRPDVIELRRRNRAEQRLAALLRFSLVVRNFAMLNLRVHKALSAYLPALIRLAG